jgi:ABC-type siderophore export system fused ATPase/permease subunit
MTKWDRKWLWFAAQCACVILGFVIALGAEARLVNSDSDRAFALAVILVIVILLGGAAALVQGYRVVERLLDSECEEAENKGEDKDDGKNN